MEPELGMKKYRRLVDIFYNYNLTPCAYRYLQFNRLQGLLTTAAFRKRPEKNIADKNINTIDFQKIN